MSPQVFGSPAQPVIRGPAHGDRRDATSSTFRSPTRTRPPLRRAAATRPIRSSRSRGLHRDDLPGLRSRRQPAVRKWRWRLRHAVQDRQPDLARLQRPERHAGRVGRRCQDVGYDFAVTYNQSIIVRRRADVIGYRLQEALNGFGGPNCTVPDLDPNRFGTQNAAAAGKNGCSVVEPLRHRRSRTSRNSAWPTRNTCAGTENSLGPDPLAVRPARRRGHQQQPHGRPGVQRRGPDQSSGRRTSDGRSADKVRQLEIRESSVQRPLQRQPAVRLAG